MRCVLNNPVLVFTSPRMTVAYGRGFGSAAAPAAPPGPPPGVAAGNAGRVESGRAAPAAGAACGAGTGAGAGACRQLAKTARARTKREVRKFVSRVREMNIYGQSGSIVK